jgi:hypothetical protein
MPPSFDDLQRRIGVLKLEKKNKTSIQVSWTPHKVAELYSINVDKAIDNIKLAGGYWSRSYYRIEKNKYIAKFGKPLKKQQN